jgi:hypothetical protein
VVPAALAAEIAFWSPTFVTAPFVDSAAGALEAPAVLVVVDMLEDDT